MFPKTFRISDTVGWRWKIVPGERTGVWERTLADLKATTRLSVLSGVGGSQITVCSMLTGLFRWERLPNQASSVLFSLSWSRREAHQLLMSAVQSRSLPRTLSTPSSDMLAYACLSTANRWWLMLWRPKTDATLFVYVMSSTGPRQLPCDTLQSTRWVLELLPFTMNVCDRSWR